MMQQVQENAEEREICRREKFPVKFISGRMFNRHATVIKDFDGVLQGKCFLNTIFEPAYSVCWFFFYRMDTFIYSEVVKDSNTMNKS